VPLDAPRRPTIAHLETVSISVIGGPSSRRDPKEIDARARAPDAINIAQSGTRAVPRLICAGIGRHPSLIDCKVVGNEHFIHSCKRESGTAVPAEARAIRTGG
jgi:hypothetical protein